MTCFPESPYCFQDTVLLHLNFFAGCGSAALWGRLPTCAGLPTPLAGYHEAPHPKNKYLASLSPGEVNSLNGSLF
jgi:hypothetical protein